MTHPSKRPQDCALCSPPSGTHAGHRVSLGTHRQTSRSASRSSFSGLPLHLISIIPIAPEPFVSPAQPLSHMRPGPVIRRRPHRHDPDPELPSNLLIRHPSLPKHPDNAHILLTELRLRVALAVAVHAATLGNLGERQGLCVLAGLSLGHAASPPSSASWNSSP